VLQLQKDLRLRLLAARLPSLPALRPLTLLKTKVGF
jgi:hypothetical protein